MTSTDDHGWHDIFMVSYLAATLPWMLGCFALSPPHPRAIKYRKVLAGLFVGTLVPLMYFFIQHKVHKVAGGIYPWTGRCIDDAIPLTIDQPTPSMPSLSGPSSCSTLGSTPSQLWISKGLSWSSKTSKAPVAGTCNGFRDDR